MLALTRNQKRVQFLSVILAFCLKIVSRPPNPNPSSCPRGQLNMEKDYVFRSKRSRA